MKLPKVITIDFETAGIESRPAYPPVPAGVSILWPGERKSTYYAWGHPTKNNCTMEEGRKALLKCYEQGEYGLLFHNAKFDIDVAEAHLNMPRLPWERYHDTMFLLFLQDPHSRSISLKPAAERILGMAPDERDAVHDWLLANGVIQRPQQKGWGAFISKAPGDVVGKYADGDVLRTRKLFDKLYKEIHQRDMLPAYDRERRLLPTLLEAEREGLCVDTGLLEQDIPRYQAAVRLADIWLRKRLGAPDLNVDSNEELADALEKSGVVTDFVYTKTGKRSVSKKNLTPDMYNDAEVAAVVRYRNALSTCLSTFMENWLEWAIKPGAGGRIYTSWNQVRQSHGADNAFGGARTGRMSSTPPLLNIPKEFDESFAQPNPKGLAVAYKLLSKEDRALLPDGKLPHLPFVRRYALPDSKKHVWLRRDYSQQEYRMLAHYEEGSLLKAYIENPRTDIHEWTTQAILSMVGLAVVRKDVKIINFAKLYGMGIGEISKKLKTDVNTARRLINAQKLIMSGVPELERSIRQLVKEERPIVTWGGREYFCEPPAWNGSRWQTYEYKLLNYLIQGSAADVTKEAIIRYNEVKKDGRFLVAVHDEIDLSVPKKALKQESKILQEVMKSIEVDVLMLSDGEAGPNWFDLVALKEQD